MNRYLELLTFSISFSISPKGKFLTNDPLFDSRTYEALYFKKNTKEKVKTKVTIEDIEAPENTDWLENAKKVDVTEYQTTDPVFYENTVSQVFDWYAKGIIQPYVGHTCKLKHANIGLQYMNRRKSLGKVLVKTK